MDYGRVRRHLSGTRVLRVAVEVSSPFKDSAEVTSDVTTGPAVVVKLAASGTGSMVDDRTLEGPPEVKLFMIDVAVLATGAMRFH
jgi:hypothetical protein